MMVHQSCLPPYFPLKLVYIQILNFEILKYIHSKPFFSILDFFFTILSTKKCPVMIQNSDSK